jgi:hypothetical protein
VVSIVFFSCRAVAIERQLITMNAAQRVEVLESKRIKDVVAAKYLEKFLTSPHARKSILASACRAPPTRTCLFFDRQALDILSCRDDCCAHACR